LKVLSWVAAKRVAKYKSEARAVKTEEQLAGFEEKIRWEIEEQKRS
jgi:hypothetical protein